MKEDSAYLKNMSKNISSNLIRTILIYIISFGSSIIYTRVLLRDLYGVYTYMMWFISTAGTLMSFGYEATVTKFLPEYFSNEREEDGKNFIRYILRKQIINVALISVLLIVSMPLWENMLEIKSQQGNIRLFLILATAGILPTVLMALLTSMTQALQRFDVYAKINVISQFSLVIITTIVILISPRVEIMIIVFVGTLLYQVIGYYLFLRKNYSITISSIFSQKGRINERGRIRHYARIIYINILAHQIVWTKSEFFFLGIYSSAAEIGIYGLAYSLINMISTGVNTIMTVMNNYFSELVAKKEYDLLRKIVFYITKYFGLVLIPMFTFALIFIKPLVVLMYSNEFVEMAAIFPILFLGFAISQLLNVAGSVPYYLEKQIVPTIISIASGVFNIVLDIILIPRYGIYGAAVANFFAQVISSLIGYIYNVKIMKFKFPILDFIKVIVICALAYLLLISISNIVIRIILGVVLFILYYFILKFFKVLKKADIELISSLKSSFRK